MNTELNQQNSIEKSEQERTQSCLTKEAVNTTRQPPKSASCNDFRREIFTVDVVDDSVVFGQHRIEAGKDERDPFSLRIEGDNGELPARSRYVVVKNRTRNEVEEFIKKVSVQGLLSRATVYFGNLYDPFFPFEKRFDLSMKTLQLFAQYKPLNLVVQSRSPLAVLAMPVFKALHKRASFVMSIETPLQEASSKFTPGLPKVKERFEAANAFKNLGVEVTIQASPLLPYGDWRKDAASFAQKLCASADYIFIKQIMANDPKSIRNAKKSKIAVQLAQSKQYFWLRHDTAQPLREAIMCINQDKLKAPDRSDLYNKQLSIFAA
jgi:DNA repair photolyase